MKKKKVFLLCPGIQKCGTTILYDVLQHSNNANLGKFKELKVHGKHNKLSIFSMLYLLLSKPKTTKKIILRFLFQKFPCLYYKYFHFLTYNKEITGDISPNYNELSKAEYSNILSILQKKFNVKIILLLRDPVERTFSQIRMMRRLKTLKKLDYKTNIYALSDQQILLKYYKHKNFTKKNNYEYSINKIKKLDNIKPLILFNENLKNSVEQINNYLNTNIKKNSFDKMKFSNGNTELDKDKLDIIYNYYRDTYNFCFKNYPITKKLWNYAYEKLKKN